MAIPMWQWLCSWYFMLGAVVALGSRYCTLPTVVLWPLVVALDFCQPIPDWLTDITFWCTRDYSEEYNHTLIRADGTTTQVHQAAWW